MSGDTPTVDISMVDTLVVDTSVVDTSARNLSSSVVVEGFDVDDSTASVLVAVYDDDFSQLILKSRTKPL